MEMVAKAPCACECAKAHSFFRDNLTILGVAFFRGIGDDKTRDSGELPDRKEGETYEEKRLYILFPIPIGTENGICR